MIVDEVVVVVLVAIGVVADEIGFVVEVVLVVVVENTFSCSLMISQPTSLQKTLVWQSLDLKY